MQELSHLEFDFILLVFMCLDCGVICNTDLHVWFPEVPVGVLELFEGLTNVVSVFKGLLDVVDQEFGSCLIIIRVGEFLETPG